MQVITYTKARDSLKTVLDEVADNMDVTVIARRDAEDAVVMSLSHYNSIMETVHLQRSPRNAERLARSMAQVQEGKFKERELLDE